MKAKYDLIKMAGWVAVAIGGLAASWATDKQSKEEIDEMNVTIGWILLLITMSVFITLVFEYDLDLKDKIICIVGTDTFVILLAVGVYLIAG